MRQTLRQREVHTDAWRYPGESGAGPPVLTLAALLEAAAAGRLEASPIGVSLGPTDEVEWLAPLVARLTLVVIQFEKSGDGRGFSQAQLLRQRLGYGGELRAAGAIQRDHLYLLARCGFDAFDLGDYADADAALAQLERYSVAYQGAADTLVHPRRGRACLVQADDQTCVVIAPVDRYDDRPRGGRIDGLAAAAGEYCGH